MGRRKRTQHDRRRKIIAQEQQEEANQAEGGMRKIVATLDLHGFTREKALWKLSRFLQETTRLKKRSTSLWVQLITGSGKHSQDGPVLRPAIKEYLDRRGMSYTLFNGKGAFIVDARSGCSLLSPRAQEDTKIVMTDTLPRIEKNYLLHQSSSSLSFSDNGDPPLPVHDFPSPAEVSADDALVGHVKAISEAESSMIISLEKKEENALKRALMKSQNENNLDNEELEWALSLSKKETEEVARREKEELDKALEASLVWEDEDDDDDELQLEKALQASLSAPEPIDDELLIEQALQASLSASQATKCDEEWMMSEAMRLSLTDVEGFQ